MIDYNQSLSLPQAMARCKALDDEGLEGIEEPVFADDLYGCARIAEALTTPLVGCDMRRCTSKTGC